MPSGWKQDCKEDPQWRYPKSKFSKDLYLRVPLLPTLNKYFLYIALFVLLEFHYYSIKSLKSYIGLDNATKTRLP